MKISYTERTRSIITEQENLERLYELKNFPVFIGCTDQGFEEDLYADMILDICIDSGMIQLRKLLPRDIVYSGYHSEAVGNIWADHHKAFAKFILDFRPENVLEIGGSNGILAKICIKNSDINSWTIVEPNPSVNSEGKIKILKAFFDQSTILNEETDIIVHSHVLEHIYEPNLFFRNVNERLKVGQHHIFSIPNLYLYLQKRFSNSINYEHTYFLTEYFCEYLLMKHGFELIKKYNYGEHSIFFAARKTEKTHTAELVNHYAKNRQMYLGMVSHYIQETNKLNSLIDGFDGSIYLFGAHIFSQFLIYLGLNTERINNIIDNSDLKLNKRLYGSKLYIAKPDIVRSDRQVGVILKAGQYQEEVKAQLLSLKPDIIMWE